MKKDFPYEPLPGRMRGVIRCGSLWLGADHILAVKSVRYAEQYQRFYFRDVQAIVMRKCPRFVVPAWWLAGFVAAGIVALVGLAPRLHPLTVLGEALMVGLGVYWIALSLFQSCRVHVKTAVSWEELPAPYRVWSARRFLAILDQKIAEVQGMLPEDWNEDTEVEPEPQSHADAGNTPVPARILWFSAISFVLLLAHSVISYRRASALSDRPLQAIFWILMLVIVGLMITAIVAARRERAFRPLRILMIFTMALSGLTNYAGYTTASFLAGIANGTAGKPGSVPANLRLQLISSWEGLSWQYRIDEVGDIVLGIAGLALTEMLRRRQQ